MELDTTLVGADLRGEDLRYRDLSGKTLFGTNLTGAHLYGAKVDLACHTFDSVIVDSTQVALLLLMLSKADMPEGWSSAITDVVRERLGRERYDVLKRYAQVA
jgi:hypothetical protein